MLDIDLTVRADDLVSIGVNPFQQDSMTLSEIFEVSLMNDRRHLSEWKFVYFYAVCPWKGTVNGYHRFSVLIFIYIGWTMPKRKTQSIIFYPLISKIVIDLAVGRPEILWDLGIGWDGHPLRGDQHGWHCLDEHIIVWHFILQFNLPQPGFDANQALLFIR